MFMIWQTSLLEHVFLYTSAVQINMKNRLLTTSAVDHVDNQKVNVGVEGARFELLYYTNNSDLC